MPCPKCAESPNSHSFHPIGKTNQGYEIIYTCPAKTVQFNGSDPKFVFYFDEHLRAIEGKPWVWIFDCQGLTSNHMLSIKNLQALVDYLYKKHINLLQGSYVLNAGWTFGHMMNLAMPLLKKDARSRIHVLSERPIEALMELERQGFSSTQVGRFLKSSSS